MSYLISVVLPVYNCGKYLRESLDSIVNQTLGIENIEVIIVDDASTDNTYEIAKEYESRYPSFNVLRHNINKGCGPARNTGLEHVTTDYVTYLDGDDYISLNAYERALEIFTQDKEVDLVIYKWEEFDENGLWHKKDIGKEILREEKIITNINDYPEIILDNYAYIKVYSKRLFSYLKFPPRTYEDICTSAKVMINAKKIYVAGDITVYYRQYSSSSSKDASCQNYLNLLIASKQVIDLRDKNPQYYELLSFLALRSAYWPIDYIINRKDFLLKEGECIYKKLKKYPQYFTKETIEQYEANFPNYLPASPDAMWDLKEMDYHEYVIKHRCQKDIKGLKLSIDLKDQNINTLKDEINLKNKKINKLKKENKKKDKKIREIMDSNSWKITKPLRKLRKKIK